MKDKIMDDQEDFEQKWLPYASNELVEMLTLLHHRQGEFLLDEKQKILKDIIDELTKQIKLWNFHKLRAQVGWPVPPPLDDLQPICELVVLVLSKQMEQLNNILLQFKLKQEINDTFMKMYDEKKRLLSTFLRSCLVIEKQPDRVVIKNTKYANVSLRLLLGNNSNCLQSPPTDVTCCLYLEKELNLINEEENQMSSVNGSSNEIDKMHIKERNGVYRAQLYKKIQIPDKPKNTVSGSSSLAVQGKAYVADQKSCFIFTTKLMFFGQEFTLQAISVPFVVLSKPNYERQKAQSLIFWDNAFAAKDRKLFDVPDAVPVRDFLEALNYYWSSWVGAGLTKQHLQHIKSRFYVFPEFFNNPNLVTKEMFNQLIMCQKADTMSEFTFWNWFFDILKFVNDYLKEEWKNGCIEGFIDKQHAEDLLRDKKWPVGTFLLRFSDSSLPSAVGGISVTCKEDQSTDGCESMPPWTEDHLKAISLLHRISEEKQCRFLYPSLSEKEDVFATKKKKTHPGYPRKKRVSSESNCSSPSSSMSESVTSPGTDISVGSPTSSLMDIDERSTIEQSSWTQMPQSQDILTGDDPFMGVPILCALDNRMN